MRVIECWNFFSQVELLDRHTQVNLIESEFSFVETIVSIDT